jgi:hypothetical protein
MNALVQHRKPAQIRYNGTTALQGEREFLQMQSPDLLQVSCTVLLKIVQIKSDAVTESETNLSETVQHTVTSSDVNH